MYQSYKQVLEKAKSLGPVTISVAVAQDKDVLKAIKLAEDAGVAKGILVGDKELIKPLLEETGLSMDTKIIHEKDVGKAALTAVSLVRNGEAQVLMKGLVNSSDFLKAVLDPEVGLRTGRLLSHLAVFEIPQQDRLIFVTDGGMNIAPKLEEKKDILTNAILALQAMGVEKPNAAILTANETVHPKMQATVDAKALVDMSAEGLLPDGVIEGPIAFDVAISEEAAKHKGLESEIAGKVDLFLVPTIETGNVLGKALIYCAKAKMAGLILGATHPIVMTSRAETAEGKLNSIALACLAKGM